MVRISKSMGELTGWKAVVAAIFIVSLVGYRVYLRMNRQRENAPPVVVAPPRQQPSGTTAPASVVAPKTEDPNRRPKLAREVTVLSQRPTDKPFSLGNLWIAPVEVKTQDLVDALAWSRDGRNLITLSRGGRLRKFQLPHFTEAQQNKLKKDCSFFGQTPHGLAVLVEKQEILLVDDETLEPVRSVSLPGVTRMACTPTAPLLYAVLGTANDRNEELMAVDLRDASSQKMTVTTQFVEKSKREIPFFDNLTLSADGKFLFSGNHAIQRARIDGLSLIVEEHGPRITGGARVQELALSDRFVAMPCYNGNRHEGFPDVGGTCVYAVNDLQTPLYGHYTGYDELCYGFDALADVSYTFGNSALAVMNAEGLLGKYSCPRDKNQERGRRILPHPKGHRFCVLAEESLFWVELPGAEKSSIVP